MRIKRTIFSVMLADARQRESPDEPENIKINI